MNWRAGTHIYLLSASSPRIKVRFPGQLKLLKRIKVQTYSFSTEKDPSYHSGVLFTLKM